VHVGAPPDGPGQHGAGQVWVEAGEQTHGLECGSRSRCSRSGAVGLVQLPVGAHRLDFGVDRQIARVGRRLGAPFALRQAVVADSVLCDQRAANGNGCASAAG
jgi:hypothetical protein